MIFTLVLVHKTTLLIYVLPFFLLILCFRYASLYFCCAVEDQDNELITLEIIHRYVELLDKYFGSVSPINIKHVSCRLIKTIKHLLLESKVINQEKSLQICCFFWCCGLTGVRVGYYLQLWESLFYPGWVPAGWRGTGDIQEERAEGHRAGWPAAGGTQ